MEIPSCLVDTNILLRMTRRSDPEHHIVDEALAKLASQKTVLYYTHQNIAEFWNPITRPVDRNGFGLTVDEAERAVKAVEAGMVFLADSEASYREWRRIVVRHKVLGIQVHDARLAALMYVHGIGHVLTLNVTDFSRFSGITALHPAKIE